MTLANRGFVDASTLSSKMVCYSRLQWHSARVDHLVINKWRAIETFYSLLSGLIGIWWARNWSSTTLQGCWVYCCDKKSKSKIFYLGELIVEDCSSVLGLTFCLMNSLSGFNNIRMIMMTITRWRLNHTWAQWFNTLASWATARVEAVFGRLSFIMVPHPASFWPPYHTWKLTKVGSQQKPVKNLWF